MKNIPYGRQQINEADIEAVVHVLRSDFLTQGPAVPRFEADVAAWCGARYAVAVSSATAGLHIACLAAGLGPGNRLWTSPNTFVASANCALYCGAEVDFVDIDTRTYNMSVHALAAKLEVAERQGTLPKIVVPVHFAGQSCDMAAISALAARYGFTVVEDAAHAIGGSYEGRRVGCCANSAMAVFSFHPVKIVTTGEGGMVVTNDEALYNKLLLLRSHGITREPAQLSRPAAGPWYYEQLELGYNYRMTDIQAALGCSQMTRLDEFVARRHQLAKRYDEALTGLPLRLPWQHPAAHSSYHLYTVRVQTDYIAMTHREIFEALRAAGIGVNLHYMPVHTQPYYEALGFAVGDFPEAEKHGREAVSLPLFPALQGVEQEYVISTIRELLQRSALR